MVEPSSLRISKAIKPELACKRYCTKERTRASPPVELGEPEAAAGVQGHRSDLAEVVEAVQGGKSFVTIAREFPTQCIKYGRGIRDVIVTLQQSEWEHKLREEMTVIVLYGPGGTGKTRRVWDAENHGDVHSSFQVEPGRGPWDKYQGQEAVVFDEFGMGDKWDLNFMKRALDIYPLQLDARYTSNWAAWKRVYIISNDPPHTWWMLAPAADKNAFWRRVTSIQNVLKRQDDPTFDAETDCFTVPAPQF